MKKYNVFKHKPFLAWLIVTVFYIALVIAIVVIAFNSFVSVINLVLGGKRPVFDTEYEGVTYEDATYYATKTEAVANANEVVREISEEGFVLVKNDNALPLQKGAKISVFGKNSVNLAYIGTGSAAGTGSSDAPRTIFESLEEAGFSYNPTLKAFYEDNGKSGEPRSDDGFNMDGDDAKVETLSTAETPYSKYTSEVTGSYSQYNDAAIIVYSRLGGEGNDLVDTREEGHYLQLDNNEQTLLTEVSKKFDKVIVVINSANALELGFVENGTYGNVDACLLIGRPGNSGIMALGDILAGNVNPSGHTVDTYSADFTKDPSYADFSSTYRYEDKNGDYLLMSDIAYTKYSEGIYVGYRYYETRGYDELQADKNSTWYEDNVVYPFGFGLSYTTFDWEITESTLPASGSIEADGTYTIKVKVTNTGSVAGKDVVQLYVNAPYTAGGIAKAYKTLCGYAKTSTIKPGDYDEVEISFKPYDIASYDYNDANKNNFYGYELESGTYNLYVSTDAHNVKEHNGEELTLTFNVGEGGIRYGTDPSTGYEIVNRFESADAGLETLLSRDDFDGTLPVKQTADDSGIVLSQPFDGLINEMNSTQSGNPLQNTSSDAYKNAVMPTTGYVDEDGIIEFVQLLGLDIKDTESKVTIYRSKEVDGETVLTPVECTPAEAWDLFMDQLTYAEMLELYNEGAFMTSAITRLGVAATVAGDGPNGWSCFMDMTQTNFYNEAVYCSETITASTWNNELAKKFGEAIGEEALVGNGNGQPYSGWYAPGANIHRSPFGGRNGEYFSEDPYLSGMMASYEIIGASSRGVTTYMKHFALNEQENHRQDLITWVDEQTLREIYLKPFEMAVKIADTHGMMSSFNRIGTKWTGGDYTLLTEVLRNEWGFRGTVISDYNTNTFMSVTEELYAGGDLSLQSGTMLLAEKKVPADNAAAVTVLRNAAKNVLYTVNNTNIMGLKVLYYKMPIWQIIAITVMSVLGAIDIGLGAWALVCALKKKKKFDAERASAESGSAK